MCLWEMMTQIGKQRILKEEQIYSEEIGKSLEV